ncbi:MAG TPA: aminotransferase class III-fold pyridoxal phosphate-dependent enzyme [Sphingomicrobium sp.]|nr:aminotransferase class III-fold pyridoxal phosphate-dependent enzyme [Sphingomicrobium sp.]
MLNDWAPNTENFWMPFTDNRAFKKVPRLLVSASGMHYRDGANRSILDGTAGLWCVNAGHGREPIVEAIRREAAILDYSPTFQIGHPLAFKLAERLEQFFPPPLDRLFFVNSGSEAVDSALKIAIAYQRSRGFPERSGLVGRRRGYHGVGFGGISVGGIENNRRGFPTLPRVRHLSDTIGPDHQPFTRGLPASGASLADQLEEIIDEDGAQTIAAVIVEPVAGSAGVLIPPAGYLERLQAITAKHDILLIFDEVITGFGRLGAPTAAHFFNVIPDLMTCAKGLTNGAVPMGCVAVAREIYDTIISSSGPGIEFFHGYTCSGHPLAAAAGLAALDVYADEKLFDRASLLSSAFEEAVHSLCDARHVIDIRNLGLVAGIELDPRPEQPGARAMETFHQCFDQGLLIRVTGDTIALSPPLILEQSHIDEMVGRLRDVLSTIA